LASRSSAARGARGARSPWSRPRVEVCLAGGRLLAERDEPGATKSASFERSRAFERRLRRITAPGVVRRRRLTLAEAGLLIAVAALALPAVTRPDTRPRPEDPTRPADQVRWIHLGDAHAHRHDALGHDALGHDHSRAAR
jgi:hypothetical protein